MFQDYMLKKSLKFLMLATACALLTPLQLHSDPEITILDPKESQIDAKRSELHDSSGSIVLVPESDIEGPTVFLFAKTTNSYLFWTLSDAQNLVGRILNHDDIHMRQEHLSTMSHYVATVHKPHTQSSVTILHKMVEVFQRFSIAPHTLATLNHRWSIAIPKKSADLSHITSETVAEWITNQNDIAIIDAPTGDILARNTVSPTQRAIIIQTRKNDTAQLPFLYINTSAQTVKNAQKTIYTKTLPKKSPVSGKTISGSGFNLIKILGTVVTLGLFGKLFSSSKDTEHNTSSASISGSGSPAANTNSTGSGSPAAGGSSTGNPRGGSDSKTTIEAIRLKKAFDGWKKLINKTKPTPPPATPTQTPRTNGASASEQRRNSVTQPSGSVATGTLHRRHSWPTTGPVANRVPESKPSATGDATNTTSVDSVTTASRNKKPINRRYPRKLIKRLNKKKPAGNKGKSPSDCPEKITQTTSQPVPVMYRIANGLIPEKSPHRLTKGPSSARDHGRLKERASSSGSDGSSNASNSSEKRPDPLPGAGSPKPPASPGSPLPHDHDLNTGFRGSSPAGGTLYYIHPVAGRTAKKAYPRLLLAALKAHSTPPHPTDARLFPGARQKQISTGLNQNNKITGAPCFRFMLSEKTYLTKEWPAAECCH